MTTRRAFLASLLAVPTVKLLPAAPEATQGNLSLYQSGANECGYHVAMTIRGQKGGSFILMVTDRENRIVACETEIDLTGKLEVRSVRLNHPLQSGDRLTLSYHPPAQTTPAQTIHELARNDDPPHISRCPFLAR